LRLPMDVRHHLYLIFKEAMNNLVRHSSCSQADIRLRQYQQKLLLEIQDNGRGFDLSAAGGGNGLRNMKNRARAIHGILTIDTAAGKGTKVALEVAL